MQILIVKFCYTYFSPVVHSHSENAATLHRHLFKRAHFTEHRQLSVRAIGCVHVEGVGHGAPKK